MEPKSPFFPQLTEIAAIKATVLKQPAELHAARLAVADADRDVGTAKRRLKDIETAIADERLEVEGMVMADSTLKNAAARKAKSVELLKGNATITRLRIELTKAHDELARAEMTQTQAALKVKRLEDDQRAWRAHLDATQAEVQLLVAGR